MQTNSETPCISASPSRLCCKTALLVLLAVPRPGTLDANMRADINQEMGLSDVESGTSNNTSTVSTPLTSQHTIDTAWQGHAQQHSITNKLHMTGQQCERDRTWYTAAKLMPRISGFDTEACGHNKVSEQVKE